jgi:hypothetical protein
MKFSQLCVGLFAITLISLCYAKPVSLYEQPKADAKVIGSVDSDAGIIPIFTPKDTNDWIKVADPRNGNVGWVKQAELKVSGFTDVQGYQISNFGGFKPLTPEQNQAMLKQLQESQKSAEKAWNQMIQALSIMSSTFVMPAALTPVKPDNTQPGVPQVAPLVKPK